MWTPLRLRLVLVLLLGTAALLTPLRHSLFAQAAQVARFSHQLSGSVRQAIHLLRILPTIGVERAQLEQEVSRLLVSDADRAILKEENEQLRNLLALPPRKGVQRRVGAVVGVVPGSLGTQVIVQLATSQTDPPIVSGTAVYAHGSAYGVVRSLDGNRVIIQPLSAPRTTLPVSIGATGITGLLRGTGTGMVVEDISTVETIDLGSEVRIAGSDSTFPTGTLVGRVTSVIKHSGDLLFRSVVQPIIPHRDVLFVEL